MEEKESKEQCSIANDGKSLFSVTKMVNDQRLLFDGYLRMEVLDNLSNEIERMVSADVIHLCQTFYILEIKTLMDQHYKSVIEKDDYQWLRNLDNQHEIEQDVLNELHVIFCDNDEFWMACKILKLLIQINQGLEDESHHHNSLD